MNTNILTRKSVVALVSAAALLTSIHPSSAQAADPKSEARLPSPLILFLPDLIVESLFYHYPTRTTMAAVSVTIRNRGRGLASKSELLVAAGAWSIYMPTPPVDVGQFVTVDVPLTGFPQGSIVLFDADAKRAVREAIESNNSLLTSLPPFIQH